MILVFFWEFKLDIFLVLMINCFCLFIKFLILIFLIVVELEVKLDVDFFLNSLFFEFFLINCMIIF